MKDTLIGWADHTHNFWIGCTQVSPGCDNCYAKAWAERFFPDETYWGAQAQRRRTSNSHQPRNWNKLNPMGGRGPRLQRVFSQSLGDFFDNHVPEQWRHEAWKVIAECNQMEWLLLTKLPQNIYRMLPKDWSDWNKWGHVRLGFSAENQQELERRTEAMLVRYPITHHLLPFISLEPLLAHVQPSIAGLHYDNLSWLIVGGESGPSARPFNPYWIETLLEFCQQEQAHALATEALPYRELAVALFVKQFGSNVLSRDNTRWHIQHKKGEDPGEWPERYRVQQWPSQQFIPAYINAKYRRQNL